MTKKGHDWLLSDFLFGTGSLEDMLVWLESTLPPLMSLLEDYSRKMKQQNETKRAISCLAPSVGNLLWSFQISNDICDVPLSSLFPQRKSGHFDLLHRTILYCKLGPSIHLINLQNWNEMAWLAVGPQLWHLNIYLFDCFYINHRRCGVREVKAQFWGRGRGKR